MIIRIEPDFPGCVVDDPVMMPAQEDEISELGLSVEQPVSDVVGVAHHRWPVAAREGAVPVPGHEGGPDRLGDRTTGASDVEGFSA